MGKAKKTEVTWSSGEQLVVEGLELGMTHTIEER
jgi:hypothetical protein